MTGLIIPYQGILPKIAEDAYIAPNATIIGKVKIGACSTILFNTVIRGDVEAIYIGERTNLQDGTIVHVTGGKYETHIGNEVSIGHKALKAKIPPTLGVGETILARGAAFRDAGQIKISRRVTGAHLHRAAADGSGELSVAHAGENT